MEGGSEWKDAREQSREAKVETEQRWRRREMGEEDERGRSMERCHREKKGGKDG